MDRKKLPDEKERIFLSDTDVLSLRNKFNYNGFRGPLYAPHLFVVLGLAKERKENEKGTVSLPEIVNKVSFLLGGLCPKRIQSTVCEELSILVRRGHVTQKKIQITPKQRPHKLEAYTEKPISIFTNSVNFEGPERKQNNIEGNYDSLYFLNPGIPIQFLSSLKHSIAEYFGFQSWYNGLHSRNRNDSDLLLNIKSSYAHKKGSKVGVSHPEYTRDRTSETSIDQDGAGALRLEADTLIKTLMRCEAPQRPPKELRDLGSKTRRLVKKYRVAHPQAKQHETEESVTTKHTFQNLENEKSKILVKVAEA